MMIDTRLYGYTFDGGAYHVDCTIARPGTHVAGEDCVANARHEPVYGIFSLDDDGYGLSCDKCMEYIFEPNSWHCADCDQDYEYPVVSHAVYHVTDAAPYDPTIEIDWRSVVNGL